MSRANNSNKIRYSMAGMEAGDDPTWVVNNSNTIWTIRFFWDIYGLYVLVI